jgi:hypothetical protein
VFRSLGRGCVLGLNRGVKKGHALVPFLHKKCGIIGYRGCNHVLFSAISMVNLLR